MANIKITNQIEALGLNYGKPSGLCLSKVPSAENTINLIVGLGGSGIDLLRETKGLINRICCADNNRRMAATRVLYLGIDTDGKDDGPLKSPWVCADGTAVKLDEGEAVELPNSSLLKFLVPAMHDANARKYPHIVEWLDYGIETAVKGGGIGACGVRQAGRLCLFLHLDKVLEALKKQLEKA